MKICRVCCVGGTAATVAGVGGLGRRCFQARLTATRHLGLGRRGIGGGLCGAKGVGRRPALRRLAAGGVSRATVPRGGRYGTDGGVPTTGGGSHAAKTLFRRFRAAGVEGVPKAVSYVLGGTRTRAWEPTTTAGTAEKGRWGCGRAAVSRKRGRAGAPITAGAGVRARRKAKSLPDFALVARQSGVKTVCRTYFQTRPFYFCLTPQRLPQATKLPRTRKSAESPMPHPYIPPSVQNIA